MRRTAASRGQVGQQFSDATVAHWIVEAPWSHQVIHSYSLVLTHLRFTPGTKPPTKFLPGATHEVALWALNPMAPRDLLLRGPIDTTMWLALVYAGQIAEPTDSAATARIRRAAELVCQGRVSPYVEHVSSWIELFGDSIMRVARPPKPESDEEELR